VLEEKVLGKKAVTLSEVKDLLKERGKESELSYEQGVTLKYAEKFAHLAKTKAAKLVEELQEIDGMTREFAVKLVDVMPKTIEVFELMVPKNAKLSEEKKKEVFNLIKKNS